MMSLNTEIPAHNVFTFPDGVTFSSNFDNGNLLKVEQTNKSYDYRIWTTPDNMGLPYQSKHSAWFYFLVTGLPSGCVLRIQIMNTSNHGGLYKYDMRPVYKSNTTNQKWFRLKNSVRFSKENDIPQLFFEHSIDSNEDKIYFAFTYPYTYTMLQNELASYDEEYADNNKKNDPQSIFYQRELLTNSIDGRRIDLLTISSFEGQSIQEYEPLLSGLFPETKRLEERCPVYSNKEIVFISARVHPGEVPAQHTFKGILNLLMDPNDLQAKELRSRYVFKLIPMLNPDGVYRGHFRMDQLGNNLNRYYMENDSLLQPSIFAAKSLIDYYAEIGKLSVYLDFHAHASKRGCFIYGNVLNNAEDQIQNQLYCKLISLNSAHFDYEACLFSKDHMVRIDACDQAKGLTAEGSGRVATYLKHKLIHSYTIECNYNTSRIGNEIAPPERDPGGTVITPASAFTTNPEKYTPSVYHGVGRACVIAFLDLRGHNPCSRISKSKFKTLDKVRHSIMMEVRSRKDFFNKVINKDKAIRRATTIDRKSLSSATTTTTGTSRSSSPYSNNNLNIDDNIWRRLETEEVPPGTPNVNNNESNSNTDNNVGIIYIPANTRNDYPNSNRSSARNRRNHNSDATTPSSSMIQCAVKMVQLNIDDNNSISNNSNQSYTSSGPPPIPSNNSFSNATTTSRKSEPVQFPILKTSTNNSNIGIACNHILTSTDDSNSTAVPVYNNAFRPLHGPKCIDKSKTAAFQELIKEQQDIHKLLSPSTSSSMTTNFNQPTSSSSNLNINTNTANPPYMNPPHMNAMNYHTSSYGQGMNIGKDNNDINNINGDNQYQNIVAKKTLFQNIPKQPTTSSDSQNNSNISHLAIKNSRRILGKKLYTAGINLVNKNNNLLLNVTKDSTSVHNNNNKNSNNIYHNSNMNDNNLIDKSTSLVEYTKKGRSLVIPTTITPSDNNINSSIIEENIHKDEIISSSTLTI